MSSPVYNLGSLLEMLVRYVRGTLAAAGRQFSAAAVAEKAVVSGGTGKKSGGGDTLGRRLFSLAYGKRSAVMTIRKWKEEGHTVRKYELNRIVRELRKLKRYKHALEVCEWMTKQPDMKLLPGDYAVHLDLIAKIRGLNSAEKFFVDIPGKMRDYQTCSALLHAYVQNKSISKAEALMEKMSECGFLRNALPYNQMLSAYVANGQFEKVAEIIQELKSKASPDVVTYNMWLTACASQNNVETAEKVFMELKKSKLAPDWVTYSTLTNLYIKKECLEKAAYTLKEVEKKASKKNRVAYSSLLSLHANMKDKDGLHRIWNKMKSIFNKMNDAEYKSMISSLVRLGEFGGAENLYNEWESVSGTRDSRVSNIVLASYINRNQMEDAERFCQRMVQKGITPCYTTWELLMCGHLKKKKMEKVLEYFKKALSSVRKWIPDKRLIGDISKNLEEQGSIEEAEQLLVILRDAGHVSTVIYNSLLRTYAKAGKMPVIIEERMQTDNVELDEETHKLIQTTSTMCVSEVSSLPILK